MHFQDKRLYGYNAVTMATSPIFFFTTIHFLVQTYQAIKKIWLCFVLPWGGVTPISRPLLENGRSTTSQGQVYAQGVVGSGWGGGAWQREVLLV